MWSDFVFNGPYEGDIPTSINGVALPQEYIDFMSEHNGGEGDTGSSWLVLFPVEELQEMNDEYEIGKYLKDKMIIGSNGAGELIGIDNEGNYFIVPDMIEEEYLSILGDSIDELPEDLNRYWDEL